MIKVGIFGASGFTGARLAFHLARHKEAELVFATSRQDKGSRFSDLYGHLTGVCDIVLVDPEETAGMDIDVLFTCMPDQTSMKIVPGYYDKGVKIVDLAGDYRMKSAQAYEKWYKAPHESPDYIGKAVYGLTELYREQVRNAQLVANPGCYPTSAILAVAPLLKHKLIDTGLISVTSMSGISGAGRGLKTFKLFYETDSNVMPYSYGQVHKHTGEIEQELGVAAGKPCTVLFMPHVVPMKTGILSSILVQLADGVTVEDLRSVYHEAYDNEYFVRFHDKRLPETKFAADTNFCDIGFSVAEGTGRAIIASAICNLGKGASGQAIQNMNVMCGFDEKEGLE